MAIRSFIATTASFPNMVNLSWDLTTPLVANEELVIKRSESIYPLFTEGTEIYRSTNSNIVSFTDTELPENLFYYYAVYIENTFTSVVTEQLPATRDFALSYKKWGEGKRLFQALPAGIQGVDNYFGKNLEKLVETIGNMEDYYRSLVHVAGYFRRPDLVAENLLDFYSEMFGFPPERGFDLRVLRNLALGLVAVYKKKGTCQGLVDFTKIFTTWDSRCDDTVDLTFRTWDPDTKRRFAYLTGVSGTVATDGNAVFPSGLWTNGKFVDEEDDPFYTVLGNNTTDIFLLDKEPPFTVDTGIAGIGTGPTTFQDISKTWVVNQWRGHRLYIDSFSIYDYFVIISNTADTLTCNQPYVNFGSPDLVFRKVDLDEIAPANVAYRIEPEYYVQQGRHSLLYDNTVPPGFRGLTKDPAHFLVGGNRSLLSLGQFSEFAVVLVIEGVANYVGRSTGLIATTLTDANANFGPVDNLVGKKLNPNILQAQDFPIIANTATTVTVLGDMLEVAAVANNYYILSEFDSIKAKRLRSVIGDFAPYYAEIFLFFEPI